MLSLLALPLLALLASATPLSKRYTGVKIQSYRNQECLSPMAGVNYTDGVAVTTVACADATAWDINSGSGSILLSGTGYALDAGTGTDNNEGVKIWTSYPTLFQQTWFLTGDLRIAIAGGDQCLDQGDSGPQTYQCTTGNTNQIWNIVTDGDSGTTTTSTTATPTVTCSV